VGIFVVDSPIFSAGMASVLAGQGARVVGEARHAVEAAIGVPRTQPHVVVLSAGLPPSHTDEGVRTALQIRRRHPHVGLLVLAEEGHGHHVERLMADSPHGIGYVLKSSLSDIERFTSAVRKVADGGVVLDPAVAELSVRSSSRTHETRLSRLSAREMTVLGLMAEGLTNVGIACRLGIGARTVESHVKAVFTKLGLPLRPSVDRRVLAVIAYLSAAPDRYQARSA
jgi:DNA-binding NarL/FixJ family response regulator